MIECDCGHRFEPEIQYRHRLLCGDSRERGDVERVTGGGEKVNTILTDPPYGIKRDKGFGGADGFRGGSGKPIARKQYSGDWDSNRPTKQTFDYLLTLADNVFIFGGNFFADILPRANHWIVWDKLNTMPTFGDCELIWTNIKRHSVKKITVEYNGLIGKEEERHHATQKPVKIVRQIIEAYDAGEIIFDPFCGSGTTMIAANSLKRRLFGIEIHPPYVSVVLERMSQLGLTPEIIKEPTS